MRVLVGGLIGAAASAAVWFYLEYATGHEMGWLAIAVGVITGLCINAAAGAGTGESYARGALAVVLTMLAMVGGRAVYASIMQNTSQVSTIAAATEKVEVAEEVADENPAIDGALVVDETEEAPALPARTSGANVRMQKPTVNDYKELEVVWMAVAALAAYFIGKGSGKQAPVVADDTVHEGTAGTPA